MKYEALKTKDMVDITFKFNDTLNFYWNFYVLGVIALLSWVSSQTLVSYQQIIVLVGFISLAILNWQLLYRNYHFLGVCLKDLQKIAHELHTENKQEIYVQLVRMKNPQKYRWFMLSLHLILDLGVVLFIALK